jgi:hypothetical protein
VKYIYTELLIAARAAGREFDEWYGEEESEDSEAAISRNKRLRIVKRLRTAVRMCDRAARAKQAMSDGDYSPDASDPLFDAGYQFVESNISRADGMNIGPFWYGWMVRLAFWSGAEWSRQQHSQLSGPAAKE